MFVDYPVGSVFSPFQVPSVTSALEAVSSVTTAAPLAAHLDVPDPSVTHTAVVQDFFWETSDMPNRICVIPAPVPNVW